MFGSFVVLILMAVLLALFCAAFLCRLRSKRTPTILDEVLSISDQGIVFFDHKGDFHLANERACVYLPFLNADPKSGKCKTDKNLSYFINYMYDHAVGEDNEVKKLVQKLMVRSDGRGFCEVISIAEDQFFLAEILKTQKNKHIFLIRDVSTFKRDEDHIARLSHYSYDLRQAVEATTNGIVITRLEEGEYKIVFANHAFYTLSGLSEEDVTGFGFRRMIKDLLNDEEAAQKIFKGLENSEDANIEINLGHGIEQKWLDLKFSPVYDEVDYADLFITVLTDISELKMRELEMFKTQKLEALGQLAAGVAHDFNNILSIIDGYSRIAVSKKEEPELVEGYLNRIQTATTRGASLTSQLLTFSRHQIVTKNVINLGDSIQEQSILLKPLINASIDFQILIEDHNIAVESPFDYITQIVMNLAVNARDAMPNGGRLTVGLRHCSAENLPAAIRDENGDADMACLYVRDNGEGMDEETRAKLFDPFFTTKSQGKGTGLGLFMVYGLVKQMGGYIDVQSTCGEGTTISIFLPLSDKDVERKIEGSLDDIESINLKGYKVLIAEDEPDLLLIVSHMLEKMGLEVISASNGNEALLKQADFLGKIDLLLTDVVMPELDGVKLARLFESERPETDVIFMSGYPANKNTMNVDLPENAVFMAKPIKYEELARLIYQTLSSKGAGHAGVDISHWETSNIIEREAKIRGERL